MSTIAADARLSPRALSRAYSSVRRRRYLSAAGTAVLSFVIVVWSLAPLVSYYGVRLHASGVSTAGTLLVVIGLVLEATVLISFGAAPFFLPFVFVPLLIATVLALAPSRMG